MGPSGKTKQWSGQVATYGSTAYGSETTTDEHGLPWVDSNFTSVKGRVNSTLSASGSYTQFAQLATVETVGLNLSARQRFTQPWLVTGTGAIPIKSDSELALMAVASMNPNVPDIDLPVSIAELRELPSLLRDASGLLAKRVPPHKAGAKANIMAQFGIAPLISDIQKLFEFTESVARREQHLREMSKGWKRFNRTLTEETFSINWGSITTPWVDSVVIGAFPTTWQCTCNRRYWFSARAKLTSPISERDIPVLAPQLVLGVHTISASQIWNLIPWSWLIDWFATTGTFLQAYRRGIPWTWSPICLMRRDDYYTAAAFPTNSKGISSSISNPSSHSARLNRKVVSGYALPTLKTPYLDSRQLGILGSLLILRL